MSLRKRLKFWRSSPLSKVNLPTLPTLRAGPSVLESIKRITLDSHGSETGGILIGFHKGLDILVTRATDAGPKALKSECSVLRDTEYCSAVLQQEFATTGADYVGEWHSHVVDLPHPSSGDLRTLAGILVDPDYDLKTFAMILVNTNRDGLFYPTGYIAARTDNSVIQINEVQIISTNAEK